MKLLDAQKIKEDKKQKNKLDTELITRLRNEEKLANIRINDIHKLEKEEKERIENELSLLRKNADIVRSSMVEEVERLEERKRKALEPLDDLRDELEASIRKYNNLVNENLVKSEKYKKLIRDLEEKIDLLEEREDSINTKEIDILKRLHMIELAEEELKKSTNKVSSMWVKFHEAVNNQNAYISKKEKELSDRLQAVKSFEESLDRKQKEQDEQNRLIADRRETLQRAWQEFESTKLK